jgi:hypothetical protein
MNSDELKAQLEAAIEKADRRRSRARVDQERPAIDVNADEAPRQLTIPCPGCATGQPVEEGGPETIHARCPGCGRLLIIIWTDTAILATFSEWAGRENIEGWGLPPDSAG